MLAPGIAATAHTPEVWLAVAQTSTSAQAAEDSAAKHLLVACSVASLSEAWSQIILAGGWGGVGLDWGRIHGSYATGLALASSDLDFVIFCPAPDDRTILTGWLLQLAQTLTSGCAPSGFHWVLHHPTTIVVPSPAGPLLSLMLTDGAELELSVDVTFHSSHHAGLLSTHTILAGPAHSLLLLRTLVGCLKPFLMSKRLVGRPGGGLPSAILVLLMQDFVLRSALASPQEAFSYSASRLVASFCESLQSDHSLVLPWTTEAIAVPLSELTYDPTGWPQVLAQLTAIAAELQEGCESPGQLQQYLSVQT